MIDLITQPFDEQFGTILEENLASDKYKHFVIVSAFARNSGVLRTKEILQDFRNRGGKIDAFIGVDLNSTSYEAVANIFSLVDSLYIVHDKNPRITFHPKIYYLSNLQNSEWIAVGSNNLTGGGLWINHETALIVSKDSPTDTGTLKVFNKYKKLIKCYQDSDCAFSMKINDISDLDKLLEAGLLRHEVQIQVEHAKMERHSRNSASYNLPDPFGSMGTINIPALKNKNKSKKIKAHENKGKKIKLRENNVEVISIQPIAPSDNSEKMWFETRVMTGGSRNILDLSMLGKLTQGSADGTRYQTDKDTTVLGSVVFFDIDPLNTTIEKDITINYKAKDYVGCTIKMHHTGTNPNGSWRIQFKGETDSSEKLTNAEGSNWFVNKIIVLEKIRTDYYTMSVLPESELDSLKSESIFMARNGRTPTSKQYGLLCI